jgi:hypothetical protein
MSTLESLLSMNVEKAPSPTPPDELIAQIWVDLEGRVSRERIRQVATEAATLFHHATITAYIPILLRRIVRDHLRQEIPSVGASACQRSL